MTAPDVMPLVSAFGGSFFVGLLAGYALKKVIEDCSRNSRAVYCSLAYLEYQRIIQVDWTSIQALSQSGIIWLTNAVTHISNNIHADHGVSTNLGSSNVIPLASSISAGLMLGLARG